MSKCDKCYASRGVFIEDESGVFCESCHPDFFNIMDPKQALKMWDQYMSRNLEELREG